MDDFVETEDRSLPYLMGQVVNRVETQVNRWARPLGLKIDGVRVLFRLLAGDRTVNQLARLTGIEISTLSRLLGRMEAMDLLTRRRDTTDGRAVLVSLTEKGRGLALKHRPVYFKDYETILLEGFSAQETRALREYLLRMVGNIERADENAVPAPRTGTTGRAETV